MRVALIAHDKKKDEMVNFAKANEERLSKLELYATGTTGLRIMENTNLEIKKWSTWWGSTNRSISFRAKVRFSYILKRSINITTT